MSRFYEEDDYEVSYSSEEAPDGYAFGRCLADVILWGAAIIIPIVLFW